MSRLRAISLQLDLTRKQKAQQIRAIHRQADPHIKAILSPGQYEKLKTVRQRAIEKAIPKRRS